MPRSPLVMLIVFAFTLFTSALLLFLVEPMIGKMITPLLGGTPAVWNTCMVFFQAVLLAGYAYAHFSTAWLGPRKQALAHLVLLLLPFVFLPLHVNQDLIRGTEHPVGSLLLLLSLTVGVPMFVVSASAPLLQKWFASTAHPAAQDPYFLYGASNLGSMIALLGYPTVVERYLRLGQQSFDWTIGYALLAVLTALCAAFLWTWQRNTVTSEAAEAKEAEDPKKSEAASGTIRTSKRNRRAKHTLPAVPAAPAALPPETAPSSTLTGEVTWRRVLRWVVLAFVPSSLMLGATTYITTDIAAISFLWVTPLALYLLSFIIVFARVPPWVHQGMVLAMPLLVLGLLFFMLSEVWIPISWRLLGHLLTLFVVSMVCHGELARDRPPTQYLTGYYLWMSIGGVIGGLFNALLAPVIFKGIIEYELVMMLACYLAPPLGQVKESDWSRRFDLILTGLFVGIGGLLIALRLRDHNLPFDALSNTPWPGQLLALLAGITLACVVALRAPTKPFAHWMDLVLPLALAMLLVGLAWGLWSRPLSPRMAKLAEMLHKKDETLRRIFIIGVPIVLCYTFVERSLRFALGVGAILLAAGFCDSLISGVIHQERSFFGVLKVEREGFPDYQEGPFIYRRLVHGTTLHGMQFIHPEDRRDEPLTYYHRTGPIGEVMMVFNSDKMPVEQMNLGVIGLGTGTMAAYARPGQHLTFYDIDPIVKRLSYDEGDPYFTFVQDARERGAHLELVMGDARLTMERQQLGESEKFGVLVVDAFSSDAIPIHLITREAMQVYLDKLTDDGLLCFHVSNRYLDLRPVLYNLAQEYYPSAEHGLAAVYQSDEREKDPTSTALLGKAASTWVVLSRSPENLNKLLALNEWEKQRGEAMFEMRLLSLLPDNGSGLVGQALLRHGLLEQALSQRPAKWKPLEPDEKWPDLKSVGVWTDDYSNLFSVFLW